MRSREIGNIYVQYVNNKLSLKQNVFSLKKRSEILEYLVKIFESLSRGPCYVSATPKNSYAHVKKEFTRRLLFLLTYLYEKKKFSLFNQNIQT
jgi:hypothetical protein